MRFFFFFSPPLPFLCFRLCLLLVDGERVQIRKIRNRMEPHSDSNETFFVSERVRTCLYCSLKQYGIARTSQGPPHKPCFDISGTPCMSEPRHPRFKQIPIFRDAGKPTDSMLVEQHVGGMARCCGKWIRCQWQLKVIPTLGAAMVDLIASYVNESRSQAPFPTEPPNLTCLACGKGVPTPTPR